MDRSLQVSVYCTISELLGNMDRRKMEEFVTQIMVTHPLLLQLNMLAKYFACGRYIHWHSLLIW